MLKKELKSIVPSRYNKFDKLESEDPYYFDSWGIDKYGNECLYYWFYSRNKSKKNQKRVVVSEVDNLLRNSINKTIITKSDFEKYCPTTLSAGPCGYAVIVRLLEYLGIAQYKGRSGVQLIDHNIIRRLI